MSWTPFTLCRKRDQYTFSPKYLSVEDPNTTDGLTVHHVLAAAQSPQWYAWGPPNMQCRLCASCWIYWKKYGGLKTPTQLDGGARGGSVSPVPYTCIPSHMSLCLAYKRMQQHKAHFQVIYLCRSPVPVVTWHARKSRACRHLPAMRVGQNCWPKTARRLSCAPPSWPALLGECAKTSCSLGALHGDPTLPSTQTLSRLSVSTHAAVDQVQKIVKSSYLYSNLKNFPVYLWLKRLIFKASCRQSLIIIIIFI